MPKLNFFFIYLKLIHNLNFLFYYQKTKFAISNLLYILPLYYSNFK